MMRFKLNGELTGDDKVDRKILLIASDFIIIQDQLYRITDVRNRRLHRVRQQVTRLCIPKRFQLALVDKIHVILAHAAYERLSSALRQRYYFAGLNELAFQVPKCCQTCGEAKPDTTPRPVLFPHSHSGKWNQLWAIDHMALPRATPSGFRYILILTEQSTRWTELALCYSTSSVETAQHIARHIIANHGPPECLRVDRASTNVSKLMRVFLEKFNIKLIPSASRASQSSGMVERQVKNVKDIIKLLCLSDAEIETSLAEILIALRSSPSKSLAVSPFYARFGYEFDLLGRNSPFVQPKALASKDKDFLTGFHKHIESIQNAVEENIMESKQQMSEQYNKYHRAQQSTYAEGDFVLLHNPLKGNSPDVLTNKPYAGGPYIITQVVHNPGFGPAYRLTNAKTGKAQAALVPSYRLKPFYSREALVNKYQPEAKQPTVQQPAISATPVALKPRSESQRKASNKTQTVNPTDNPPIAILQQKDDMYLVMYRDKSRSWVKRSPQLDSLLKQWLMKREASRLQRNESRKMKTQRSARITS